MAKFSSQKSNLASNPVVISWSLIFVYLIVIIGAEVNLLLDINPGWVILVYGFMLISLLVFSVLIPESRPILIGLSGIPIFRIVAFGLPFSNSTPTAHFGLTGIILLFYIVIALRMPDIVTSQILKIPDNRLAQIFVILSGVAVGFFQFWVYPQESLHFQSNMDVLAFIAALFLLAFVEETIFRGILLTGLTKRFSHSASVILCGFIYTSMFIPFGSFTLVLVMLFISIFYGSVALRLDGLYGVIGAHFISSIFYYLLINAL